MADVTATVLRLEDGRDLAYAERGDPAGVPVFAFHGTPGDRDQVQPTTGAPLPGGVRLICPDRPGYGFSSFQVGRRLTDWPADVGVLADHLGLDRFGVVGISGGGPHALVCAWAFGERLLGTCCVSGIAPIDEPEATDGMLPTNRALSWLGRRAPAALPPIMALQSLSLRLFGERAVDTFIRQLPEPDQRVLADPELRAKFLDSSLRARGIGRASGQDFALFARPWGFALEDIRARVHFWQGGLDRNVPPSHVHRLAARVPDAVVREYPDEGHLLAVPRLGEILEVAAGKA